MEQRSDLYHIECVYPVPAKRGPKPKLRSPPFDPHSTSAASALDDPNMLQLVQQHTRNSSVGAGAGKAASPVTLSAYEALLQKYNQLKVELEVESRLSQHCTYSETRSSGPLCLDPVLIECF